MVKTPHRLLHDRLTPEQYKQICKYITAKQIRRLAKARWPKHARSMLGLIEWHKTDEGFHYWANIYRKLEHEDSSNET